MRSGSKLRLAIVNFVECMCGSNPWKESVERGKESHINHQSLLQFFQDSITGLSLEGAKIADPVGTTGITILSPFTSLLNHGDLGSFLLWCVKLCLPLDSNLGIVYKIGVLNKVLSFGFIFMLCSVGLCLPFHVRGGQVFSLKRKERREPWMFSLLPAWAQI